MDMLGPEMDMQLKKNHVLVSNGYVSYCLMVICLSVGWSYVLVSDGHMS